MASLHSYIRLRPDDQHPHSAFIPKSNRTQPGCMIVFLWICLHVFAKEDS